MLSKKTIDLCIKEIRKEYAVMLRNSLLDGIEGWDNYKSKLLYDYEHALYELQSELQNIEDENLSE